MSSLSDYYWHGRLTSNKLLRAAGAELRVTDGLPERVAREFLDVWTSRVGRSLAVSEERTTDDGTYVTICYSDSTPESSVAVLNSLLGQAVAGPIATGGSGQSRLSPAMRNALLSAKDELIRAEETREQFVADEIDRRREELLVLRVQQAEELQSSQARQQARQEEQQPINASLTQEHAEFQKQNGDAHNAQDSRNPEYVVLERALVEAQTERQKLLDRFATDHAAVSRVELEIGQLELLLDQTPEYFSVAAVEPDSTSREPTDDLAFDLGPVAATAVALPPEEIDMEFELARVKQSAEYGQLHDRFLQAQQALALLTDRMQSLGEVRPTIIEAPQVVAHDRPGITTWQFATFLSVAVLVGFVFSVMKNLVNIPEVLYAVKDVKKSLRLPLTACLSIDNAPDIPAPPTVVRPKVSKVATRMAEFTLVALVGTLLLTFAAQPRLFEEFVRDPLATYMSAFQLVRSFVPIPYLFN